MASEANTKRAEPSEWARNTAEEFIRSFGLNRQRIDVADVAPLLDAAEQRGREGEAERWQRKVKAALARCGAASGAAGVLRSLLAEHDAEEE